MWTTYKVTGHLVHSKTFGPARGTMFFHQVGKVNGRWMKRIIRTSSRGRVDGKPVPCSRGQELFDRILDQRM